MSNCDFRNGTSCPLSVPEERDLMRVQLLCSKGDDALLVVTAAGSTCVKAVMSVCF